MKKIFFPFLFFLILSLWKIIYKFIPGASAIRAVILLLPLSFTIILYLKNIALLFCLIIIFKQKTITPSYDKFSIRKEGEALNVLAIEKKIPFYYSPLFGTDYYFKYQMDAQWASLLSKVPTINGYFGNKPKRWELCQNTINKEVAFTKIYSENANFYGNEYIYSGFDGKINSNDMYYYLKKTGLIIEKNEK